jgi:hypothetical protein
MERLQMFFENRDGPKNRALNRGTGSEAIVDYPGMPNWLPMW